MDILDDMGVSKLFCDILWSKNMNPEGVKLIFGSFGHVYSENPIL